MEWLIRFIGKVISNIIAFVVICIVILSAPLASIAVVVLLEIDPISRSWGDSNTIGWFVFCPFFVGVWYMFIASMTHRARAKHLGLTPHTGILRSAGRHIGGTLLSFAAVLTAIFAGEAVLGPYAGMSETAIALSIRELAPVLLLAAWSPVLINLTRHFMRRYPSKREISSVLDGISGTSESSPVAGR